MAVRVNAVKGLGGEEGERKEWRGLGVVKEGVKSCGGEKNDERTEGKRAATEERVSERKDGWCMLG